MTNFETFWSRYPRRIGKLAAVKAYRKARTQASAEEILAGVERYLKHMPREPQFQCHPSTFLNQGRWMDDLYDAPAPQKLDWFAECQRLHGGACGLSQMRHHTRKLLDGAER